MPADRKLTVGSLPIVLAAAALGLAGCAGGGKPAPRAGTYEGASLAMGGGSAWTFVTLDDSGKPTAIGVRFSEAALGGLPTEHPKGADGYEYPLRLPSEAAAAGYDHVGVDWNPMGHIPPGVYDVPHFDFHFYLIDRKQRGRITLVGDDLARAHKAPAPQFMPTGYALPPGTEVAGMGAHAIRPAGPEFNKQPFARAFIYGFYDGRMIFLEPMVAKAFLDARPDFSESISVPDAYAQHAYYPTSYRVRYDAGGREYVIALEGLQYR